MSSSACIEPTFPDFKNGVPPGPLRCGKCGHELELRCANGHVNALNGSARSYKPKPCAKCGEIFDPTGPRAKFCPRHQ